MGAALLAAGPGATAQVVPDSVPANTQDIRNFRIDTPAPTPPPVVDTPVPAPTPEPVAAPTPAPTPAPATPPSATAPSPPPVARTPRRAAPRANVRPAAPATAPVTDAPPILAPEPEAVSPPAAPITQAPATPVVTQVDPNAPGPLTAEPVPGADSNTGLWIGLALLAALGIVAVLVRRRLRRATPIFDEPALSADPGSTGPPETEPDLLAASPVAVEEPMPFQEQALVDETVAAPIAAAAMARPRLDIAFTPAAAGATDAQASVDYSLVVTNSGDAPASKVRMETRMFAMGHDHDAALADFFAQPLEKPTPVASAIPPGVEAAMRAQVTLPREAVRPIQVRDRTVFVPLVAFNLLYEWYDADGGVQHGQTAMSYVVGRENRPPAAKMAPFRLDQGPKIYREVGQRAHQMKQVA